MRICEIGGGYYWYKWSFELILWGSWGVAYNYPGVGKLMLHISFTFALKCYFVDSWSWRNVLVQCFSSGKRAWQSYFDHWFIILFWSSIHNIPASAARNFHVLVMFKPMGEKLLCNDRNMSHHWARFHRSYSLPYVKFCPGSLMCICVFALSSPSFWMVLFEPYWWDLYGFDEMWLGIFLGSCICWIIFVGMWDELGIIIEGKAWWCAMEPLSKLMSCWSWNPMQPFSTHLWWPGVFWPVYQEMLGAPVAHLYVNTV